MLKTCSDTRRLTLHGPTMGTRWSVTCDTAPGTDVQALQKALAAAVQTVDTQMSPWLPQSDLNRLNAAVPGTWLPLPPEILEVLECALDISRLSYGTFDPAMGALVDAWGFGPVRDTPDATAIRAANEVAREVARTPTHETLELDRAAGQALKHAPLQFDLCGIAKGYAVDCMARVLEQHDVRHALIALDGELRALGSQFSGQPWAVALERPDTGLRAAHGVIELQDLAVATSGDYRRYWEAGDVRLSHTMDARTCAPVRNEVASVTVLARTCMHADAWATALLVAGPGEGLVLAQRMGLEALWLLRRDGALVTLGLGRFGDGSASAGHRPTVPDSAK